MIKLRKRGIFSNCIIYRVVTSRKILLKFVNRLKECKKQVG
jgi:hypothetical protein